MTKRLLMVAVALPTLALASVGPAASQNRPLAPMAARGLPITPFMEGWYPNEDGSYIISFGYYNPNRDQVIRIPAGENNSLMPAQYNGMQPTVFQPGRHRGVFAVTIPSESVELLWQITSQNGETREVPGRSTIHSYQLDHNPRPAGSLPPHIGFAQGGPWGWDPSGIKADRALTATAGQPLEVEVWTHDPSQRDPEDPRYETSKPLRVVYSLYQAPARGDVTFTRHESTPVEEDEGTGDPDGGPPVRRGGPPSPAAIMIPEGAGPARVYATFSTPGEYVLRAQVDNWRAPDSSSGDQCCWSNAYITVNVR